MMVAGFGSGHAQVKSGHEIGGSSPTHSAHFINNCGQIDP